MRKSSQKSSASGAGDAAPVERVRRQRGHQRVEVLLGAAAQVFAERGYDAATMTEIAARAESSIGSLYQFFPTKPEVAQGVIALQAGELQARLAAMAEASAGWDVDELSARLVVALIEFRAAHPSFARLVDSPGAPAEQVQAVRQAMRVQLAQILAPHAAGLTKSRLAAVAVAVQQVMKAAVTLNTEAAPGTRAALVELKEMLRVYLRAALLA
jgi:AcrR family transcriptional regulator